VRPSASLRVQRFGAPSASLWRPMEVRGFDLALVKLREGVEFGSLMVWKFDGSMV
jgi:hypothetical protein